MVDESRDRFVFSMIDAILEREIPLFAICRGFPKEMKLLLVARFIKILTETLVKRS
ncbi:MAG: hypothetical protein Ct9H300mP4_03800 [Gammaproteobacteria bacterium]|nr:MAG: hypothetical protein Ct9H300mP4_03800 [Gammaproteobacteria bacterium]